METPTDWSATPLLERRRFSRLNFPEPLRFRNVFKPHEDYSGALARDLSARGVSITIHTFLPKDARLVVLLDLPELAQSMRIIGRVCWVQKEAASERFECGLEFIVMAPEDHMRLADYVERGVVSPRPTLA